MFLSAGGGHGVWKNDSAEVYLFILQAKQQNRAGRGRESGIRKSESTQKDKLTEGFLKSRFF